MFSFSNKIYALLITLFFSHVVFAQVKCENLFNSGNVHVLQSKTNADLKTLADTVQFLDKKFEQGLNKQSVLHLKVPQLKNEVIAQLNILTAFQSQLGKSMTSEIVVSHIDALSEFVNRGQFVLKDYLDLSFRSIVLFEFINGYKNKFENKNKKLVPLEQLLASFFRNEISAMEFQMAIYNKHRDQFLEAELVEFGFLDELSKILSLHYSEENKMGVYLVTFQDTPIEALNNFFNPSVGLIGGVSKTVFVDFVKLKPVEFAQHDQGHYNAFYEGFEKFRADALPEVSAADFKKEIDKKLRIFKKIFLKSSEKLDDPKKKALLDLVFFQLWHELPYAFAAKFSSIVYPTSISSGYWLKKFDYTSAETFNIFAIKDLKDAGAIFRQSDSKLEKQQKVKDLASPVVLEIERMIHQAAQM